MYTAWNDPAIDRIIEGHMGVIIAAIHSRLHPESIILQGSFGKGEGSVFRENGKIRFLSDYDIVVISSRSSDMIFRGRLGNRLKREIGVRVDLSLFPPDFFQEDRFCISQYEAGPGARTIDGRDFLRTISPLDAARISLRRALVVILRRMADCLHIVPGKVNSPEDAMKTKYWANKLLLACVGALILSWDRYIPSYVDRASRFSSLSDGRLEFMGNRANSFQERVRRATEFQLRPRRDLYPGSARDTWREIIPDCMKVFNHLAGQEFRRPIDHPGTWPRLLRQSMGRQYGELSPGKRWRFRLSDLATCLRRGLFPKGSGLPYGASPTIYGVIPLLLSAWDEEHPTREALITEARRWLVQVCPLRTRHSDLSREWNHLRRHALKTWAERCPWTP
jgi:hypothetical protein